MYSNILSVVYADKFRALANYPTWAKQVDNVELQSSDSTLSYVTIREEINNTTNMVSVVKTLDFHVVNTCTP